MASHPRRTRFEPSKATGAGPNPMFRPSAQTSSPPGLRTRKISRSANGAMSGSSSRADPDDGVDGRRRSRKVEYGTILEPARAAVRVLQARRLARAQDHLGPIRRATGQLRAEIARQIVKDQQNSTGGVTAQEALLRRRDRFGQRRRRGSRFRRDQLRGEVFRLRR